MTDPLLVLMRHGASEANDADRFSGWSDERLSERGMREAAQAGALLATRMVRPTIVHTSLLSRAIRTADIALEALDRCWIPVRRTWRLNERHYGALQGRPRQEVLEQHGPEAYGAWRRSHDARPPRSGQRSHRLMLADDRYADVPPALIPATESLADLRKRVRPAWLDILSDLHSDHTVLVVSHGNTLRALIALIEGKETVGGYEMATGAGLIYRFNPRGLKIAPEEHTIL